MYYTINSHSVAFLMVFVGHYKLQGLWFGMSCSWLCATAIYGAIISRTDWSKEALNATKRNAEALRSTKRGANLAEADDDGVTGSVALTTLRGDDKDGASFSIGEDDTLLKQTQDNEKKDEENKAVITENVKEEVNGDEKSGLLGGSA